MEDSVKQVFQAYQEAMDDEQKLRENIKLTTRELERVMKSILGIMQGIHQNVTSSNLEKLIAQSRTTLGTSIIPLLQELATKVPPGDYFKFNDMWRFIMTKLCFSCSLITFLETNEVPLRQAVADMLGLSLDPKACSIYLDVEDYLHGLLQMASELSRFCTNCVAQGDFERPQKIFKALTNLQVAFGELNLKNDSLRRMFDGLKYDVKRVEQIMYDVSIRGLVPKDSDPGEKSAAEPAT